MKQSRIDKILETIDEAVGPTAVGRQSSSETSYTADGRAEMPGAGELCVRCDSRLAGPSGWCDGCRPDRPEPERPDGSLLRSMTQLAVRGCSCHQCSDARAAGAMEVDAPDLFPNAEPIVTAYPSGADVPSVPVRPGRIVTVTRQPDGSAIARDEPDPDYAMPQRTQWAREVEDELARRGVAARVWGSDASGRGEAFVLNPSDPAASAFRSMAPVARFELMAVGEGVNLEAVAVRPEDAEAASRFMLDQMYPGAVRAAMEAEESDSERRRRLLDAAEAALERERAASDLRRSLFGAPLTFTSRPTPGGEPNGDG